MRTIFIAIIFILPLLAGEGWGEVKAQDRVNLDSLFTAFKQAKHDTTRIKTYLNIGDIFEHQIPDTALYFYNKALELSQKTKNNKLTAKSLRYIGIVHQSQGSYDKAIEYYLKSLKIYEELGDKKGMSKSYNNIGLVHKNQGLYDKAIEYFLESLKINKEMGNKKLVSSNYNNIGVVHDYQGSYDKAIEYYLKSLKINEELGDKNGMSNSYGNIGNVHYSQGLYDKAIEYYLKSLKINEELGDKKGMSNSYGNIGNVHKKQGLYDKAIEYYLKSLKIYEETGDKYGIALVYGNIASLHITLADSTALSERQRNNYMNKAVEYGNKAYNLALEIDAVPMQNDVAVILQKAYTKLGRYKEAIKYAEIFIATQDSMFSEEKTKALAEMGAKYETEKKQLQIEKMENQKELDNKTIEVQKAENRKQLIIIISAIAGFLIVLIFSIILLRMFSQKRKANILLAEQKAEIEEKNRDIMDSITYAKRIQSAILPPQKLVKEYLKESFILYKPKDIVAGDFYWIEHKDGKVLFAAADCTGHGVPGAMVSVVCNNGLNRSVRENGLTEPGKILDKTREIVIQEFEKSEEEVKDGMDIAICSLEGNRLQYAGAHNPLWIIRNGEILETKADRQPIGKSRLTEPFTTHTIELQKADSIYIFSDGYVDQFGGEKGKKFKAKAFKELLINIQNKTMEEQRLLIDDTFENWRGELEQIDDVVVMGVKI